MQSKTNNLQAMRFKLKTEKMNKYRNSFFDELSPEMRSDQYLANITLTNQNFEKALTERSNSSLRVSDNSFEFEPVNEFKISIKDLKIKSLMNENQMLK